MRNYDEFEIVDAPVVARVGGVERQPVGDRGGRDERVVRLGGGLAAHTPQIGDDAAEGPGARAFEGQHVEVGLRLLQVSLAAGSFGVGRRDERPGRQFGQGDRRDGGLGRKRSRVCEPRQQDHNVGVEHAPPRRCGSHSDGSTAASTSRRSDSGSM